MEVQEMATRSSISQLIHYNDDVQVINGHIQSVTWGIESFTVSLGLTVLHL
jgi:hypothetical protein